MTIAYVCLLIAVLLPYVWVFIAKQTGERLDNHDPRAWQARQTSPRAQRAYAAHLNAFEALPAFVAGVLAAQLAGVAASVIGGLAVAFVVFRVLHGVLYVTDKPALRSPVWGLGFLCVLALLVLAIIHVG